LPLYFSAWHIVSAGEDNPIDRHSMTHFSTPNAASKLFWALRQSTIASLNFGTPSEIKSEGWATSSRIRGRLPPESAESQKTSQLQEYRCFWLIKASYDFEQIVW
jgi:hypothetical protein